MIINKVKLTNIGPYQNENTIQLGVSDSKNTILIGGENGAGKTTFLNAIKIGLFGAYGFGYRTNNNQYFNIINDLLNEKSVNAGATDFSIVIDIQLIDNFIEKNYIFERSWTNPGKSISENLTLFCNNKRMTSYEVDVFFSKLQEVMPPQLLELCLFDGETISDLIDEKNLSIHLKKLSRIIFNLDLFHSMEGNLNTYSQQLIDQGHVEESERKIHQLNQSYNELRKKLIQVNSSIETLLENKNDIASRYSLLKYEFETYGGLVKEERDALVTEINELSLIRKQNSEEIKLFVSSKLPFYISADLLSAARNQIKQEEEFHLYKQLDSKLTIEEINYITNTFNIDKEDSTHLRNSILSLLLPEEDSNQIHGASFSESSLIENKCILIEKNEDKDLLELIEENQNILSQIQNLNEKLRANDSATEFSDMIIDMEDYQEQLISIESDIELNTINKNQLLHDLDELNEDIVHNQKVLKDNDKMKSSYKDAQNIIKLSKHFRQLQLAKKLQEVQFESTAILKKILRKKNYIKSILIDANHFEVSLIDIDGEKVPLSILSAGEKQMLLLALIWGFFKASGRKAPFIFDTLLGRLDRSHKNSILTEYIPYCGDQAIILSTDSEIDVEHYNLIKDHLSYEYTLDYKVRDKKTNIIPSYFSNGRLELKK